MDLAKGIVVLVLGLVPIYLILAFANFPGLVVAFSVIYLAAVIAAKSFGSDKKG